MFKYPIKYIEDNLIFNRNGEVFAYYELMPYNYNFLSDEKKYVIHSKFSQLVSQQRVGRFQALQIETERSIREIQKKKKKGITGNLKDVAIERIDGQTETFLETIGENQVDYRFYIGFKLILAEEEKTFENLKKDIKREFQSFIADVGFNLMGDFLEMPKEEIERYKRAENIIYNKIKNRFSFRRVDKNDIGYLIEHINGLKGKSYEDYEYITDIRENEKSKFIKRYDLLSPCHAILEEKPRYIKLTKDEKESYVSYLTISSVVSDLEFPSSEIFYYQQEHFNFPIDTSMNVEILENKKALSKVRNKKKELKDLRTHAFNSGNETSDSVESAWEDSNQLEDSLSKTKGSLYKLSYVIRVFADSLDELTVRVNSVIDFYDDKNIKLVRPYGDMLGLHNEFILTSNRYINDYIQYVESDFLASLGFGVTQQLGDDYGIYVGYNIDTGRNVYINPSLPAQGVLGSSTNALAKVFLGSLGGGKSMSCNILTYYSVIRGAYALILDPKSERGNWAKHLPEIKDDYNVITLRQSEENKGMLDPYVIMKDVNESESLAIDILTFLSGISARDGDKFPHLVKAVKKVSQMKERGLLKVIEVLKNSDDENSKMIGEHIGSFADYDFAILLFSDGTIKESISVDKAFNVLQISDLVLPEPTADFEEYTTTEMLSVAMLIAIATFALEFIRKDNSVFKIVLLDEAWSYLNVAQGKALVNKLIRTGRALNSASDIVTQGSSDVSDEKMRNNIGMKFAFRSTDFKEIEGTLKFFGLDVNEENINRFLSLENGQCLFQDTYGRCGVIQFDPVYKDIFEAFDTRPPIIGSDENDTK